MAIQVTLARASGIYNIFNVNFLEPYQTSKRREAVDPTQVLRNSDTFITEDCTIEEIMGGAYDKQEKWVMYLVQLLDYSDREDWIEVPFEYMTTALKTLGEVHKSKSDAPQDSRLRA
jgi:hypothetical protein